MSDQYNPQNPTPTRPSVAGVSMDPNRPSDYRADPPSLAPRSSGGFGTGLLVAIVFVVVAIIAAAVFSNRDMFGVGNGVTPTDDTTETIAPAEAPANAPAETTVDPIAPTPAPGQDPTPIPAEDPPVPAPGDPATPPVQSAPANP